MNSPIASATLMQAAAQREPSPLVMLEDGQGVAWVQTPTHFRDYELPEDTVADYERRQRLDEARIEHAWRVAALRTGIAAACATNERICRAFTDAAGAHLDETENLPLPPAEGGVRVWDFLTRRAKAWMWLTRPRAAWRASR